ncbi:LuxR family transcriptional regulator [Frankia sp. Hr75.2]|nr:LuxR family transcriptional regulator [Frankia sp. Hr75.2]
MVLIEREDILRRLDVLLEECSTGRGRVVLVDGPVGTGKTEVIRYCDARAAENGMTVCVATCARAEHVLPLGVVGQLLRSVRHPEPDGEAELDGRQARIAELLEAGAAIVTQLGTDTNRELVEVFQELTLLLLDLSTRRPVLVRVDDVQHADTPSLHFLLHLVRRLGSAPLLLLLAGDLSTRPLDLPVRAELGRAPEFRSLRLQPLSPAGTRELFAALHPAEPGAEAPGPSAGGPVLDPFEATGGNPLLLTAFVQDHWTAGHPTLRGFGLALLSCLHRGGPATVLVAQALAVLETPAVGSSTRGGATDPATLAGLAGARPDVVVRAVDAMTAAGLLEGGWFRHPAAREAILDDLTGPERIELHRRAAQLRYNQGAPSAVVAVHLVEGDDAPPWGTVILVEAAEQALLDGHPGPAADRLRLAMRSAAGERERAAVQARLAHAEWQISPAIAARHLSPLVAAASSGLLNQRAEAALVRQLLWHGRGGEAEKLLGRLRAQAREQPDDGVAQPYDLEIWLACVHPPLARRRRGPAQAAGRGVLAAPASDSWLRSVALLGDAVAAGGHRGGREPRALALRPNGPAGIEQAENVLRDLHLGRADPWAGEATLLSLLLLLTQSPHLDTAVAWCDRFLAETGADPVAESDARDQTTRALVTAARAGLALEQGDLAVAADHARTALRILPPKAWGVAVGMPLGALVLAAVRAGDVAEAARHLVRAIPEEMPTSRYELDYLHARGHYHLATDHPHAALADFLACGDLIRGWGLDAAALVPWRIGAAEAWLQLDNVDQARQLVQEQLGRPSTVRVRGLALRLLAAVSPPGRRLQPLVEALELLEAAGDRLGQAHVLADLSRTHDHLDQRRRARLLLRRALRIATMCGARPLTQKLLAVTGDSQTLTGAPQESITGLTDSERRVASLAVMGYTNREIARRLYITPSTVEQHLTRVYRKLNVKRRQDLPVDLWTEVTRIG